MTDQKRQDLQTAQKPFMSLRRNINDLFDDFFTMPEVFGGSRGEAFDIKLDVNEEEKGYRVSAEIPGVREEDLDVSVTGNNLTIKARREHETKDSKNHIQERYYGEMIRSLALPENADTDKINANYNDGVLELYIPKSADSGEKKIQINKKS